MRRDGFVALLYLAAAIAFFFDAATGRGAFFHYDTWMQNYAFRAWWFAELKQGHFATWCPGMFAGYPLFAETQTGPLYPPTFFLFLVLPPIPAFSWNVILHFAMAGFGMHLLARRWGASFWACLLAGITFAFSGFLVTHVVHFNLLTGAALLPFAIYFACGILEHAKRSEGMPWFEFLGLSAVAAGFFLGSHPYALFMALFSTLVCAVCFSTGFRSAAWSGLRIAGAWILGAGLGAVQLFPAMKLLEQTSRGAPAERDFLTFGSFPPWNIGALANPDVFGTPVDGSYFGGPDWSHFAETCAYAGVLPLGLAIAALVLRRDRTTWGLLILASAGALLMLGEYSVVYRILEKIPVLQSTRLPARFALITTLAVAGLAALGLDALIREGNAVRRRRAAGAALGAIALLCSIAWFASREARHPSADLLHTGSAWPVKMRTITDRARASTTRAMIVTGLSAAALVALSGRRRRALAMTAPLLAWADLASWGASFNPRIPPGDLEAVPPAVAQLPRTEPRPRIFRQGMDEIWERTSRIPRVDLFTPAWKGNEKSYKTGAWALPPNSQLLYDVDSGEGFTSLIPLQWLEWMGQPPLAGAAPRPDLTEAQADLLSIDAVISSGSGIAGEKWEAQALPGDVWVSRNVDPLPRVRLATSWAVASREHILEQLRRDDYNSKERTLLEKPLPGLGESHDSGGGFIPLPARELAPGKWSIEAPPGTKGVIVLGESFDPGWRARSPRGEPLDVVRADGLFCAIAAPPGGGAVLMSYKAPLFLAGAVTSGIAAAVFVLLLAIALRSHIASQSIPTGDAGRVSSSIAFFAIPIATMAIVIVSIAANTGNWRGDIQQSSLTAAAVRAWSAEAQGAYMAQAWDAAAALLEKASQLAPEDPSIRYRKGLVERERAQDRLKAEAPASGD